MIFSSCDGNEAAFDRYFAEMPWVAVPYTDARNNNLKQRFGITGIPTLIVLNQKGDIITAEGRSDVQTNREGCFEDWLKQAAAEP